MYDLRVSEILATALLAVLALVVGGVVTTGVYALVWRLRTRRKAVVVQRRDVD